MPIVVKRRNVTKGPTPALQKLAKTIAIARAEHLQNESDWVKVIKRYKARVKNPMTAIRAMCIDCSGGSLKEVTECKITTCALHPFRHGKNPFHKKTVERLAAQGDSPDTEGNDDDPDDSDAEE